MTAQTSPRPGLVPSAARIFDLSLGQMLWSKRSIFLALVAGGPVALAFAFRAIVLFKTGMPVVNGSRLGGPVVFGAMIWLLYVRFVVPVLGVFYGTAIIADEVDDKTITYLFTRPIPRASVLLGKYLAFLVCTVLLVLPSVLFVFFTIVPLGGASIGQAFPALLVDLGVMTVGLAAYGAVFGLVGARTRRPLIVGLLFAFGWEPFVMLFPGYLRRLTVSYYLQALVPHPMPQDSGVGALAQVFSDTPSIATSLLSIGIITLLALWWACRVVETREYVLEQ